MGFGRKNGNSSFVMTLKIYCNFKGPINTVEIKNTDTDYSVWIHIKPIPIPIYVCQTDTDTDTYYWYRNRLYQFSLLSVNP